MTGVAAWAAGAAVAVSVGTGVDDLAVVPVDVQPAINIDTMSNARRPMVTKRYELRLAFIVFNYHINWTQYTLFRHRIYRYIYKKDTNRVT
jgi:hypothetical protein